MLGDGGKTHHLLIQCQFGLRVVQADVGHALRVGFVTRVVFAGHMVGAERICRVNDAQTTLDLGHMRRSFLAFAGDQVILGTASYLFCSHG